MTKVHTKYETEYEKRLGEYWWIQWETIRRHPDYIKFCNTQTFDKNGRLLEKPKFSEEATKVKKRFGLKTVYHYSEDFSKRECFENFDIFEGHQAVVRIWPEVNIDESGPQSFIPEGLPQHGEFIYLGINISAKWEDIEAEVWRHVTAARIVREQLRKDSRKSVKERIKKIKSFKVQYEKALKQLQEQLRAEELRQTTYTHGRDHLEKIRKSFEVWDLRKERKSYPQIAKELYPRENLTRAENRVKKQFAAAYKQIMSEKYDPEQYKEIFKSKELLPIICKNCPNRKSCKEPCPDILPYIDSDTKTLRESTFDEKTLDYLSLGKDGQKRPEKIEY